CSFLFSTVRLPPRAPLFPYTTLFRSPRRGNPPCAGGCAARVPGLRARDLARSLVPRPDRDAHPRRRGRLAVEFLHGQLPRVRGGQAPPSRRGGRAAAQAALQAAGTAVARTGRASRGQGGAPRALSRVTGCPDPSMRPWARPIRRR